MLTKEAPSIVSKALNGADFNLSDYKGKVVILHFWSLSCAACFKEIPELHNVVEKYKADDVVLISLMNDPKDKIIERINVLPENHYALNKEAFGNKAIKFEIIPDASELMKSYRLQTFFPQTFFINKRGIIAGYLPGYFGSAPGTLTTMKVYSEQIDKLLQEKKE